MTDKPTIRQDLSYAHPINWEIRAGRLFIETKEGKMENVFVDPGDRATREEITNLLHEHFDVGPGKLFTPQFFRDLRNNVSANRADYEDIVTQLVEQAGKIPDIDAKHTTISDEGVVWASTQNHNRKGLALVVLKDVDENAYRPRSDTVLQDLASRLPPALDNATDRAGNSSDQSLLGLMKVLETIGTVDSHASLQVRVARAGGKISVGALGYAGMDADLLFLPEAILPTPLGEERRISDIRRVFFREELKDEDKVQVKVHLPGEVMEMMDDVLSRINEELPENHGPKMTQSSLIRMSLRVLLSAPGAVTVTEEANDELLKASQESPELSTLYLDSDLYNQLYEFVDDHPHLGERPVIRIGVSAVTGLLSEQLGQAGWRPSVTPVKNEEEVWAAIRDSGFLNDLEI